MRAHHLAAALVAAAMLPASAQQENAPFTYHCKGNSRILPSGLALGKADWRFEIQPEKKLMLAEGKSQPIEIDQYRISFPMEGKHWISITRATGRFNLVKPIHNPERKMQEYLLYEGECKRA